MPTFFGGGGNNYRAASGTPPSAPQNVTSATKDAAATVYWYAPASAGSSSITHYVITPYIGGSAQSSTTVAIGSVSSLTDSNSATALYANVTGLTNSTAYTFSVRARSAVGDGAESTQSGANTPLANLVFGDDFNGTAGSQICPEWWVYTRCGYLAQNEVQYYLPAQTQLDGNGNLQITATHTSYTGPSYPSAGGGNVTQAWRSGAVQSNTRTYAPTGTSMTFESRFQVCPDAGGTMWPGFFWLEGQSNLTNWKTDPNQGGWDNAGHSEIDVAEWFQSGATGNYGSNLLAATWHQNNITSGVDLSAAMHTYQAIWTPSTSIVFKRDGSTTATVSADVSSAAATQYFLLIYLQILAGSATSPQSCFTDYVRVYDNP